MTGPAASRSSSPGDAGEAYRGGLVFGMTRTIYHKRGQHPSAEPPLPGNPLLGATDEPHASAIGATKASLGLAERAHLLRALHDAPAQTTPAPGLLPGSITAFTDADAFALAHRDRVLLRHASIAEHA